MKSLALGLALAIAAATAAFAADPIEGLWKTEPDDGAYAHVTIAPCGPAFCGVFTRTFNASGEYQSPNLGKRVIIDMVPNGPGHYRGSVWRPSNNIIYTGKIALSGTSMALSGCVAGGLLCSKQRWERLQ
jgi:uncharacterized protein (DUF2147 family)